MKCYDACTSELKLHLHMIWLINMFQYSKDKNCSTSEKVLKTVILVTIVLTAVWLLQTNHPETYLLQYYAYMSKIEDFDYC